MTALDDTILPVAKALLESYGLDAVFFIRDTRTYDPSTSSQEPDTVSTCSRLSPIGIPEAGVTSAVASSEGTEYTRKITPPEPFKKWDVDGLHVKRDDLSIYVAAQDLEFTVKTDSNVTIGGSKYKVVGYEPVYSGEQVALYKLHLRKGTGKRGSY